MIAVLLLTALLPSSCLLPPLADPVVDAFRAPACTWCPGNRGLEYEPAVGTQVTAAAGGEVTFSGLVAGTRYVVVDQGDGLRATYGRLATTVVGVGARVVAGSVVGTTTDRFLFGLRRGDTYIDPAPLLATRHFRARLLPIDGSRSRPPPPPVWRCAAG